VSSASQAVSLLGLNTIRSLVLAFHIFSRWDRKERFLFDPDELWRHSLNVSCLARDIAELEHADNQFRENAAIGGMFHDLGKLVLATHLPDSSCAIGKLTHGHLKTPLEAETQVLGATHAEIGAYLLALWGFGDPIVKAAAFHHKLDRTDSQGLSVEVVVHVANVFDYEEEGVLLPPDTRINAELLERLGLRSRCEQWRAALLKRHAETAQPATPQAAKDPTKGDLGIEEA
jgi:putative nucleotidyltransferase with HDIG domain